MAMRRRGGPLHAQGRLERIAFAPVGDAPGIDGLAGAFEGDGDGWRLALDPRSALRLDWPSGFGVVHNLALDGELLGDNDGAHSPVEIIVQKALKAGLHPMEVRYFDCNGGVLQMELVNEKGEKEVLPKEWLKN